MRALARRMKERGELDEGKSGDKQSKSGGAATGAQVLGVSSPAGERGGLCSAAPFPLSMDFRAGK